MTLSRLRIEDISLFNFIKYNVLGYSFIEQLSSVSVSYNSSLDLYVPDYTDYIPSPGGSGRGWVPFDELAGAIDTTIEQTARVSVVGASSYRVNYLLGGIESAETPTSVSFYWNYVSVIDGWPGVTPPTTPIVAIDIQGSKRAGFQLGSGFLQKRDVYIHIFATNSAERYDITEVIFNALYNKSIKLLDYSAGDYLDYDGFYNSSFTSTAVTGTSNLYFEDVSSRNVDFPGDWSDVNKYRSVISFTMFSYVC